MGFVIFAIVVIAAFLIWKKVSSDNVAAADVRFPDPITESDTSASTAAPETSPAVPTETVPEKKPKRTSRSKVNNDPTPEQE